MKKVLIILVSVAVVIAVGFGVYSVVKDDDNHDANSGNNHQSSTSQEPAPAPAEAQSGEVAVTISDFKYQPQTLKVKKGSIVTWTNQDDVAHDVVSDSDSPKRGLASELLSKGESYSFTFTEVGTYTYHCRPHPYMTGTVEVVE